MPLKRIAIHITIFLVAMFFVPQNHASMAPVDSSFHVQSKNQEIAVFHQVKTLYNLSSRRVQDFKKYKDALDISIGRYLDTDSGTFTQVDPTQDGTNWYAYVGGDPINFNDPSGYVGQVASPCMAGMGCGGASAEQRFNLNNRHGTRDRTPTYNKTGPRIQRYIQFVNPPEMINRASRGAEADYSDITPADRVELSGMYDSNRVITGADKALFAWNMAWAGLDAATLASLAGPNGWGIAKAGLACEARAFTGMGLYVKPRISLIRSGGFSNSASSFAQGLQGSGSYPGVDTFRNITLKKGTIIYGGVPGQSNFYTIPSAITRSEYNSAKLFKGLQVEANPVHGYRPGVTAYEVIEDIPAAFGRTMNNPHLGNGNLGQIVVKGYKNRLRPVYSIRLD